MEYTITRALAELKHLKDKYNKNVYNNLHLVAVKHGKSLRPPYSQYKPEDFENQAKEEYQSVCDLERRIALIKNKIDESNFTTKVKIGDKEMTIIEVLNYKNNILSLKESRLAVLKDMKKRALADHDEALEENKDKVERFVSGKNANSSNVSKTAMELEGETVNAMEKIWEVELVDPINIDKEIENLTDEIEIFKHEIDFVLSESNSITKIEVD